LTPALTLLIAILGDRWSVPTWFQSVTISGIFFTGLIMLVRVQFARRHRNEDVRRAFLLALGSGFALLAILVLAMYFNGSTHR
jgi:hypothetical protein